MLDNYPVCYRVCAKKNEASVYDSFVFLGRALHPIVGCELRKIGPRDNDREATTIVEYRDATRIWAERLNGSAVRSAADIRFESPTSDQVLGSLGDGCGTKDDP